MAFTAEYSLWFTLLCLSIAGLGAWTLYRNNPIDSSGKFGKWVNPTLAVLRFLTLFFLCFLLLGPVMKYWTHQTEKPIVVLAIDGSKSILANKDSGFYQNEFLQGIRNLENSLGENYEVKTYTFGGNLTPNFDGKYLEKETNISGILNEINNNYSGQPLGAIVLASDGLYNKGNNPIYTVENFKTPIYTIALGDSNQQKDLLIKHIKYNQLVYAGNYFPIQIDISAFGLKGKQTTLMVSHKGKTLINQKVAITDARFYTSIPLSIEAKEPGTQHYIIQVSSLSGEVTTANNRFDLFMNVIDGKQKIALIYQNPHPDISAYKQSIEQNANFAIQTMSFKDIVPAKLKEYSLIIFHQLPGAKGEGANLVKAAVAENLSRLYVLGSSWSPSVFSTVDPSLTINSARASVNEVMPSLTPNFSLFTLSDEELTTIQKYPPLYAPYGNYQTQGEVAILFKQQIGNVKTDYPLFFFAKNKGKSGYICGEGFWKWRLYDAALSNQQVTSSLIGKMAQYLAVKTDRSPFRVNGNKQFDENQPVNFEAEVYNESFELIQQGEVQLQVENDLGKKFNYTFSKTDKSYSLDMGIMPVGNYTYMATTSIGTKVEKTKGQFAVIPLQLELLNTAANHQLLNELSIQTNGLRFYPSQLDELAKGIQENETIKPTRFSSEELKSWINIKGLFFTILAFLSIEWFIRKWNGSI